MYFVIGDCHDFRGHKDICVTGAIYNYTKQLTSGYHNSGSEIRCKHQCFTRFNTCMVFNLIFFFNFNGSNNKDSSSVTYRQFDRGPHVLITFYWGCPSGLLFLAPQIVYKSFLFSFSFLSFFSFNYKVLLNISYHRFLWNVWVGGSLMWKGSFIEWNPVWKNMYHKFTRIACLLL